MAERDSLVRVLKIANKNLFDVQEAAKIITKQAIVAETERDALAARLKDAEEICQTEMDKQHLNFDAWYAARSCRDAIREGNK